MSSRVASSPDRIDAGLVRLALVLMFAAIIALLDTTVVNVAIESLAVEFDVPLSTIQWVGTGYLLAVAVAIPVAGWAIDRFGGRHVWLGATLAFLIGSALAGSAWNAESLIAFRVLQGLGGGMIEPVVLSMVARAAGPRRIDRAMNMMIIPINLGPVLGPIIGGLIVDQVDWRWIFFVNLPLGAIALALGWRYIPRDTPQGTPERLDLTGLALLPPGFAAVIYALTAASEHGGFGSLQALVAGGIGIAMLSAYVVHAVRMRGTPLLDLRILANARFAAASISLAATAAVGFATLFLLPLYLQEVRGTSGLEAGFWTASFGIGAAIGMTLATLVTGRIPVRTLTLTGATLSIVASLLLGLVSQDPAIGWVASFTALRGFSMALVVGPTMGSLYGMVAPAMAARATTAIYIVLQLGASLGVAIAAIAVQSGLRDRGVDRANAHLVSDNPRLAASVADVYAGVFFWQGGAALLVLAAVAIWTWPRRTKASTPVMADRTVPGSAIGE